MSYHTDKTRALPISHAAKCADPPHGCGSYARKLGDGTAAIFHEPSCPVEAAYQAEQATLRAERRPPGIRED